MFLSSKDYLAGGDCYQYPASGDPKPPSNAKVLLLTKGGVCVVGYWSSINDGTGFYIGWAPLPKRNREKEATICTRTANCI